MTNIVWCVAHTQPMKEQMAKQHLLNQGYGVYLPQLLKTCRHARKIEQKMVPLFPRYIFISMDVEVARWRSINSTRGIAYLLMSNTTTPAYVPTSVMDDLKSQETDKGIVTVASLLNFVKGEKVRIVDGAFTDHLATFEALDDKSRVQLLLDFMGREMRVALPMYSVEAA